MDPKSFKKIGRYLHQKRKEKKLTQLEVSRELGLSSQQFISNFERGLCAPSWKVLRTLITLYDLPKKEIVDLLMEEQERWVRENLKKPKAL